MWQNIGIILGTGRAKFNYEAEKRKKKTQKVPIHEVTDILL